MNIDPRLHMVQFFVPLDRNVRYRVWSDAHIGHFCHPGLSQGQLLYPATVVSESFPLDIGDDFRSVLCILDFEMSSIGRIRKTISELKPGDTVLAIARRIPRHIGHSKIPSFRGVRYFFKRFGFRHFEEYCLAPSLKDIRWIFPNNAAAARNILEFYQPSIKGGRYRKLVYEWLTSLNVMDTWAPYRIFIAEIPGLDEPRRTFKNLIAKVMKYPEIQLGLFTGTSGYYHKVTFQVVSNTGAVLAYAKTAITEQATGMINNEMRVLDVLRAYSFKNVALPYRIWSGNLGPTFTLLQSNQELCRSGPLKLSDLHVRALSELFLKNAHQTIVRESRFFKKLNSRVNWVRCRVNKKRGDILSTCFEVISSKIGTLQLLHGFYHRDFTPWNTKLFGRKLYIFDLEYSLFHAPPFLDLFHFIITSYTIVEKIEEKEILIRLKNTDFQFIRQYSENVSFDRIELWPFFLVLYLVDLLTFYLKSDILQGDMDPFENPFFLVRFRLLKLMHCHLRNIEYCARSS